MALSGLIAANAAAAAAAAAGAGKKAAQVQLQAELNTDDDWNKFLLRDGLLVVDVYSEWCGPCIGMVGNLKKIKLEIGGDNLHLAVARSDTIECLKRFRNRSEPTWMFVAAGQLVNVVFGADAPLLARTIEAELKNEDAAKRGERERPQRLPAELTPQEQEVADALEKINQDRREREARAASEGRTARREARARRLEAHFSEVCPALLLPHAQKHLRKVADALEPCGVIVADKCPQVISKDNARILGIEDPELSAPATMVVMAERPSLVLLLKKLPDKDGDVIEITRRVLFGDGLDNEEDRSKKPLLSEELRADAVPGLFVPTDRHQRAAALDILFPKMVGALVESPPAVEPPHVALVFGAWQRRAVLTAAAAPEVFSRVLRYGFFADSDIKEPKLLVKTLDQYEARPEKDYTETLVMMVAVGLAEPALADPAAEAVDGPPAPLLDLGPVHVSADAVLGADECARFFPPGYNTPEPRPKPKQKKKKKKRHEAKEDTVEDVNDVGEAPKEAAEVGGEGEAEVGGEGDVGAEGEEGEEGAEEEEGEEAQADKATSPPPQVPL